MKKMSDEEKRIRIHMLQTDIGINDIAKAVGIARQDVSAVIRGKSRSPSYVRKVYEYLKLGRL